MRFRDTLREDWGIGALIAASGAIAGWLWPLLPERVPTHWNVLGQVDGWTPRAGAVWGGLGLLVTLWLGLLAVPAIDPRRHHYAAFAGTYRLIRAAIVAFLAGLYVFVLLHGAGLAADPVLYARLGVPLLLIVIGNSLGRVRPNFFVGIRTPWTLADEGVWRRTHRFGARTMVAAGLVGLPAAALPGPAGFAAMIGALLLGSLAPVAYSYWDFARTSRR